jgi:UPF0042 nucleotide-binding protein
MKIFKNTIIIITGCSGSGKSTALAAFEDAGFYCIDNMPVLLVSQFFEQYGDKKNGMAGWAFVMDLRDKNFLGHHDAVLATLTKKGFQTKLVFLDADENTIMRRYNQTRRHYPLDHSGGLLEAVMAEKDRMTPVKQKADYVIDTSHQSVHELKFAVFNIAQKLTAVTNMGN